jgi:hypothetical protein
LTAEEERLTDYGTATLEMYQQFLLAFFKTMCIKLMHTGLDVSVYIFQQQNCWKDSDIW